MYGLNMFQVEQNDINLRRKGPWSHQEDESCKMAVIQVLSERGQLEGFLTTGKLPMGFSWKRVEHYVKTRKSKQCRERWMNHLAPGISFDRWTKEEDKVLMSLYNHFGKQWIKYKEYLIGRPENQIKMRWRVLNRRNINENEAKKLSLLAKQNGENSNEIIQLEREVVEFLSR